MEENQSFTENCNDYVTKVEDIFVVGLIELLNQAHETNCKCEQCAKRPGTYRKALATELDRLAPPHPTPREIVVYERREKRYFNE